MMSVYLRNDFRINVSVLIFRLTYTELQLCVKYSTLLNYISNMLDCFSFIFNSINKYLILKK